VNSFKLEGLVDFVPEFSYSPVRGELPMAARDAKTGNRSGTSASGGRRQKDKDGHAVPGQDMSDSKPASWDYTDDSRLGPGSHGTSLKVGK